MAASTMQLLALLCVGASLVQCQRFQQSAPSVVEPDYDYSDAPQQRSQAPIASRATGPSPALRNSLLNDATVKTTTPIVAILKQINRHNEDGSYTYGYEGGDGSFKIETKLANGEVMGKYGYVDTDGKVRVIEYGANKYGFQPSGEGITVPPPNLVEEVSEEPKKGQTADDEFDDQIVVRPTRPRQPARQSQPAARPAPSRQQQPQPQQFASATFQSRNSFVSEESQDPQQSTAPLQFLPQEPSPARSQQFSAPPPPPPSQFSGSAPAFSAFLTSDDAPPPRHAPARQLPQFSSAPAPPRPASFPGAAPAGLAPPRPQAFAGASPQPARPASFPGAAPVGPSESAFQPQPTFQAQPAFRPRPAQGFFQPSPSFSEPQRPVQRQGSSSILDQLAQDYALPQGGARPLHDITFGAQ